MPESPKKKSIKNQANSNGKVGYFKPPLPPADKKIFTNSDKKYYD